MRSPTDGSADTQSACALLWRASTYSNYPMDPGEALPVMGKVERSQQRMSVSSDFLSWLVGDERSSLITRAKVKLRVSG
jgi:hypothetical protein